MHTPAPPTAHSPAPNSDPSLTRRLHQALMPDYNRKAAAYWWAMVTLGAVALGFSLLRLAGQPLAVELQVAVGCLIAMMAGIYPVRIPRSANSFAAGEIFIFLLLLIHGPEAAVVAAGGEAFVGSLRTSKRWTSRLVSPASAAVAMSAAGWTFCAFTEGLRGLGWLGAAPLLLLAMLFAMGYFVLNTVQITVIPHLKQNVPIRLAGLVGDFGWVGITYAASSLIAGLLYLTFQSVGLGVLVAGVPIIVMLLSMLHIYFRKRELDDDSNRVRIEAAEREAEQAARHVRELQASEQRFHSAFFNASIGMALLSTGGRVLQANPALCALVGLDETSVGGRQFTEIVHPDDAVLLAQRLLPSAQGADERPVEVRCLQPSGREVWMSIHTGYFEDGSASERCLILQAQDITARRLAESQLQHIAYHDSLTGLVNRARFRDCLARAIERSHTRGGRGFALMYLDFDRFKLINDTQGHSVGDRFLVTATQRILQQVRPGDVVGRLGGDEFAILIEDVDSAGTAVAMAERLQASLSQPYLVEGAEVNSSASIGITLSDEGYHTPDEVLRDADIAMYRAKANGRAQHAMFDTALRAQVSEQVQLELDLRTAIDTGALSLAYQPIYDLATGEVVAFEALARWNHPQRGPIAPGVFIPIAEESGLIGALTELVLERACQQLRAWQTRNPAHRRMRVQINLSGVDLSQGALALQVATTLLANGLEASQLTLEITESKLMTGLATALDTLKRLRDIGVGISVDDFGTGYSSLSYLSTLPISSLKVDRSFVANMAKAEHDTEIVKAIVGLGNALGKTVIAEGIESPAQLSRLRALGCRFGQGYLLAPPMAPEAALQLVEAQCADGPLPIAPSGVGEAGTLTVH
ncbi:MAG: bifunctional diguanylate cyclase/phosphodiesterase [Burkholderiaceae bacterium]